MALSNVSIALTLFYALNRKNMSDSIDKCPQGMAASLLLNSRHRKILILETPYEAYQRVLR